MKYQEMKIEEGQYRRDEKERMEASCDISYDDGGNGDGERVQGIQCAGKIDSSSTRYYSRMWNGMVCGIRGTTCDRRSHESGGH